MKNNNLEKIYNKLPKDKTLLKAELAKVELAIADDIKGLASQIKAKIQDLKKDEKIVADFRKKLTQMFKDGEKLEGQILKRSQSGDKLVDKAIKLENKAEKAAKDLGVSPSNIGGFDELNKLWGDLEVGAGIVQDDLKQMFI